MPTLKIKSIKSEGRNIEAVLNVAVSLDRSTALDQDLTITKNEYGLWTATIALNDFPAQESPEDAAERLSLWLLQLSKGIKGRNIKKFKINDIFKTRNVK